ncbi:MAG: hypothetical protein K2X99_05945 [Gemmatimonadaceae bacterium]|nr:hypothetical protein [Gemmatimonadaceae bacterium]
MLSPALPIPRADWLAGRAQLTVLRLRRTSGVAVLLLLAALVATVERASQGTAAPSAALRWTAAFLLASVLSFVLGFLLECARPTLASAREAALLTGLPVRVIPRESGASQREAYHLAYLALGGSTSAGGAIVLTRGRASLLAELAHGLATAAVEDARAVVIIDGDADAPSVHARYGIARAPGCAEALVGVHLWRDVIHTVSVGAGRVQVIAAGDRRAAGDDRTALGLEEWSRFRVDYDVVIVVAPSGDAAARAVESMVGGAQVACVVEEGVTRQRGVVASADASSSVITVT